MRQNDAIKRMAMMAGDINCCLFCGRDTRSKSGVCLRCEGKRTVKFWSNHEESMAFTGRPSLCDGCGSSFRGEDRLCDECRGLSIEQSYHGENYGDDE